MSYRLSAASSRAYSQFRTQESRVSLKGALCAHSFVHPRGYQWPAGAIPSHESRGLGNSATALAGLFVRVSSSTRKTSKGSSATSRARVSMTSQSPGRRGPPNRPSSWYKRWSVAREGLPCPTHSRRAARRSSSASLTESSVPAPSTLSEPSRCSLSNSRRRSVFKSEKASSCSSSNSPRETTAGRGSSTRIWLLFGITTSVDLASSLPGVAHRSPMPRRRDFSLPRVALRSSLCGNSARDSHWGLRSRNSGRAWKWAARRLGASCPGRAPPKPRSDVQYANRANGMYALRNAAVRYSKVGNITER